jgi:hypothetical protein
MAEHHIRHQRQFGRPRDARDLVRRGAWASIELFGRQAPMAQSRSHRSEARGARAHAGTWTVVAVLLAAAVVGTLWVPFYNRSTPALGGFPFYYWYQLLWIPIVAVLSGLSYVLVKRTERRPAGPASPTAPPNPGQGEVS